MVEFSRGFEDGELIIVIPNIQMKRLCLAALDVTGKTKTDLERVSMCLFPDRSLDLQTEFLHPDRVECGLFHIGGLNVLCREFVA